LTKDSFIAEAKWAMGEVRRTLAALVDAVGANPQQPQEMSRRFGLDKTLTWKIARFICDDDMLAAAVHLPGKSSVKNLVEAMVRNGAPMDAGDPVLEAMERFEALVASHSGDRETFEVMLGSASNELAKKRGETSRRQLYQGGGAVWGVQARVHVSLHFVAPCQTSPDRLDFGVVCGFVDFRRLRSDVSWSVARRSAFTQDGTHTVSPDLHPMDETLDRDAAPLIRRFCSNPVPELSPARTSTSNITRFEIPPGPIGHQAAATCILGWIARNEAAMYRTDGDTIGEHIVRLSTPAEILYHDLYVHRSLGFAMNPQPRLYSDLPGGPIYPFDGLNAGLLPVTEDVIDLGIAPTMAMTSDIPNYREMVGLAIERLGWKQSEFHGFRLRLRYPPIPALALLRYDLPERPA
jgi:hypothetical protein